MARFPDEQIVVIDGATIMVKVVHVLLCHSRLFFVRAYPRETQDPLGTFLRNAPPGRGWCLTHTTRRSPSSVEPVPGHLRQRELSAICPRSCRCGTIGSSPPATDAKTAVDTIFVGRDRA
ncbi:hypothetical protein GCM10011319_51820 [Mameliella alba]|nr:hypothetical protein GCM10011319_51820 [Mameliella alba]